MPCRPPRTAVGLAGALSLSCAALAAACDGPGNTGKTAADPMLAQLVPWANGVLPDVDATGQTVVPDLPQYPAIQLGVPDPGSQRINCAGLDQYEFSQGWFDSFELTKRGVDPTEVGVAPGWASYDDLTKLSWHAPGDATWYPGLNPNGSHFFYTSWGLPAVRMPGPSCDETPNDWVLHFNGGLFRKWGGGISHAFTDPLGQYRPDPFSSCDLTKGEDFCPPALPGDMTTTKFDTAGLPTTAADGSAYLQSHDFFDVSTYDGIAFWARRGPEGHDTALIILTDKFTSSRLARENQKYCRRIRECHTRCLSGTPCAPNHDPNGKIVYRCFDPSLTADHNLPPVPLGIDTELDQIYPRCGASACTSPDSYLDKDFDGKACTPYTFPSADESGEYCFNPGEDPPPASRDERCQDGWQTSVQLAPDWTFYALPWSQFGQVGFGKKAPYMDLKSIDTIAFGATMGWADVYFDNVTLYRRKK
jgi:hypothetical protein